MFTQGFCVDLETTLASKVPDEIRPKGYKRFETRIIEIGAVHVRDTSHKWGCLVNPIPRDVRVDTPQDLFSVLRSMYQRPDATINFWSKVLVQRKSVTETMFLKKEPPQVWLNRTTANRAKDFVRWHNTPKLGPKFVTERQALQELLHFTRHEPTWYAHNGRSFDFKILKGCGERCGISYTAKEVDTLRAFRKMIPGHKSYSQPILYKTLFKRGYNAHVAIDDATALSELCQYVSKNSALKPSTASPVLSVSREPSPLLLPSAATPARRPKREMNLTFRKRDSQSTTQPDTPVTATRARARAVAGAPVTALRGIGLKSSQALGKANIFTCAQLKARFDRDGVQWLRKVMPRGVRWRVVAHSIASVIV